ncbi:hypothetical protein, partial [Staphylococcus pseudintermedius]|uniref:hypothetical protein n=1 Tax=Staphylococcus pseudintermedius TaxID=283734 RepID=UPI001C6F4BF3
LNGKTSIFHIGATFGSALFIWGAVQKFPMQQKFRRTVPARLTRLLMCPFRLPPCSSPLIDFN